MKRLVLVLGMAFAAGLAATADKLYMKDGRTFEGKVVEETDKVVKFKMKNGTLPFEKDQIDHIEKGTSSADDLTSKLEALTPSNPLGYVEVAEACAASGNGDGPTVERLGNIAIFLDPSLCGRAQAAIGDWYSLKNNRARAAEAFLAAYTADWKNTGYREKFLKLRDALDGQKRSQMKRLSDSLTCAIDGKLADAISGLQASANAPGANLVSSFLPSYSTYAAFLADARARVPCKTCGGKGSFKCVQCEGAGSMKCTVCDGKGYKETKKNGVIVKTDDCNTCDGKGKISCPKCKGAGTIKCSLCKGVPPKSGTIDRRGLTAFRDALEQRIGGALPAEEQVGPKLPRLGSTSYDEAFTEDGKFVYTGGRWTTPEDKK